MTYTLIIPKKGRYTLHHLFILITVGRSHRQNRGPLNSVLFHLLDHGMGPAVEVNLNILLHLGIFIDREVVIDKIFDRFFGMIPQD